MPVVVRYQNLDIGDLVDEKLLQQLLVSGAREQRDLLIQEDKAPPEYRTLVDGAEKPDSEALSTSTITYKFNILPEAVKFAFAYCVARSPVLTGAYMLAWMVAVDGRKYEGDLDAIPGGSTVFITNPMPYHRKIDMGSMKGMRVPPAIIEQARQACLRRFPTLDFQRLFLDLPHPYILKSDHYEGRHHAGDPMTYPALQITERL